MKRLNATTSLLLIAGAASRSVAATTAFDPATGRIGVDMASFLARDRMVFSAKAPDSTEALPVGNGRVGAMVWCGSGLSMQISGTDISPQAALAAGTVRWNSSPAIDVGVVPQSILSLYDGALDVHYGTDLDVKVFGVPGTEILGIHVEDRRTGVKSSTLDLGVWDPATRMAGRWDNWDNMMVDLADVAPWKTVATNVTTSLAGISRGQADAWKFGYTLAATVEGTTFTTSKVDARNVRIAVVPAASYTIWIDCASRMTASGNNSVTSATTALAAVASKGYAKVLAESRAWWADFWGRSFVQYSDPSGQADYLEAYYYLSTYVVASGSYGMFPFHFINGIYRTNNDMDLHWSGGYWHWNTRNLVLGFLPTNRPEAIRNFHSMYTRNQSKLATATKSKWSVDGVWVPETMRWDGDAKFTLGSDYTEPIFSTGGELGIGMYARFRYFGDSAWMRDTAYAFLREAANFLSGRMTSDGTFHNSLSSNAHEMYWKVKNPITDLAAVRGMFPSAIALSQAYGVDGAARAKWQTVLSKLAPYKTETVNGTVRWLPHDLPKADGHNVENITSELAWPYDRVGVGSADYATAVESFRNRVAPYAQIWSPDPIQAARLGLGDSVFTGMKRMLGSFQNRRNGFTTNDNGTFEYMGAHVQAVNESFLHSWNDTIRVFPAVPSVTGFVGRFTLLARGGFLVSSEFSDGVVGYVGLKSLRGEAAVVANPWGTEAIRAIRMPGGDQVATGSGKYLSFPTVAGGVYVVERVASPYAGIPAASVPATPNLGAKSLVVSGRTLFLGVDAAALNAPKMARFYQNINYDGLLGALGPGSYTMAQLKAAGVNNDDISSMELDSGVVVELFDQDGFATSLGTYRSSVPNFMDISINDMASSLKIQGPLPTRAASRIVATVALRMVGRELLADGVGNGCVALVDAQGRRRDLVLRNGRASLEGVPGGVYAAEIPGRSDWIRSLILVPR